MDIALLTSPAPTPSCYRFNLANHIPLKTGPTLRPRPQLGKPRLPISASPGPPGVTPFRLPLGTLSDFTTSRFQKCIQARRESEAIFGGAKHLHKCNGGIGVALLSLTSNAKLKISPFVATLAANPTFVSALLAWFVAQSTKVVLNFLVEKKWDLRILCASGGMPSSHSALCTALTTSVALCHGVADSLFPVCLGFSSIVMYDAIGVRRHAGIQAEVLNMIVADLFQGHPISQRKLKELLGHTPSQVFAGAVLGILVACVRCGGCLIAT